MKIGYFRDHSSFRQLQEAVWIICWRKLTALDPLSVWLAVVVPHCVCCRERRRCRRIGSKPKDKPRSLTHMALDDRFLESGIHRSSVHRIMKTDLKLKCLKKTNAQALTASNKQSRMTRARQLLEKYPATMVNFIFFTDEKVFTVSAPTNSQNDRIYVRSGTRKKNVDENRLLRTRPSFSKSVMVSVGISKLGCTSVNFVEPGVKMNGNNLLGQKLLLDMRAVYPRTSFFCVSTG